MHILWYECHNVTFITQKLKFKFTQKWKFSHDLLTSSPSEVGAWARSGSRLSVLSCRSIWDLRAFRDLDYKSFQLVNAFKQATIYLMCLRRMLQCFFDLKFWFAHSHILLQKCFFWTAKLPQTFYRHDGETITTEYSFLGELCFDYTSASTELESPWVRPRTPTAYLAILNLSSDLWGSFHMRLPCCCEAF